MTEQIEMTACGCKAEKLSFIQQQDAIVQKSMDLYAKLAAIAPDGFRPYVQQRQSICEGIGGKPFAGWDIGVGFIHDDHAKIYMGYGGTIGEAVAEFNAGAVTQGFHKIV